MPSRFHRARWDSRRGLVYYADSIYTVIERASVDDVRQRAPATTMPGHDGVAPRPRRSRPGKGKNDTERAPGWATRAVRAPSRRSVRRHARAADPMTDKWALVVGGSGALGAGIVGSLAQDGWNIGLTYRKNAERAETTAEVLRSAGCEAVTVALDLTEPASVADALASFLAGRSLNAFVYAAGPFVPQLYVSQLSWQQLQDVLLQDVVGTQAVLGTCLPALRSTRGAIVALTTTAVRRHAKRDILSAAPKAALEAVLRGVAAEEGRYGVRANCVAVGMIQAGLYEELVASGDFTPQTLEVISGQIPLRRLGAVQDVAETVRYLLSPGAAYVTGETIHVDGGRTV